MERISEQGLNPRFQHNHFSNCDLKRITSIALTVFSLLCVAVTITSAVIGGPEWILPASASAAGASLIVAIVLGCLRNCNTSEISLETPPVNMRKNMNEAKLRTHFNMNHSRFKSPFLAALPEIERVEILNEMENDRFDFTITFAAQQPRVDIIKNSNVVGSLVFPQKLSGTCKMDHAWKLNQPVLLRSGESVSPIRKIESIIMEGGLGLQLTTSNKQTLPFLYAEDQVDGYGFREGK